MLDQYQKLLNNKKIATNWLLFLCNNYPYYVIIIVVIVMAKRKLKKKSKIFFIFIIVVLAIIFLAYNNKEVVEKTKKIPLVELILKEQERQKKYDDCLASKEVPEFVKEIVNPLEQDLTDYISKYNVGFKYQEKTLDYELAYHSDTVFYGASLIKLVDAIYLLDNDVDLNLTKKSESKYKMAYSSKTSKHSIGEDISLEKLMNYAISVSDNSAHLMLIDYIGFSKLQEYGKSLGGKVILQGGDKFGNQTADDMMIYLNKAYELINSKDNGHLLKEAMLNTEVNYLNLDDVVLGHKYGSHSVYFHDVGILFSDNPYLIAVLTTSDKNKSVVTEISKKVYNIHNTLIEEKTNYCDNLVK